MTQSHTVIMEVAPWRCPRGQSAAPHGWTGATELLAHDLEGAPMRKIDRNDRCRPRDGQPRERQPPGRPHLSRGDHLHCARDSMPMRRCHVLCLHGSSCSKWWLTLHEEDLLCIRCHAHVPVCTQKQPFKRERCSLMMAMDGLTRGLSVASRASHRDINHVPARPHHQHPRQVCFVCDT